MKRAFTFVIVLAAVCNVACAVNSQKQAIRDARIGIAIGGVAVEAADNAAVEVFEEYDATDTEMYCRGEIVAMALEEAVSALTLAADAVRIWETSLAVYLTKKEADSETEIDWSNVLSSEAEWFKVAVDVVAVLTFVVRELDHAGVSIPSPIGYAVDFLVGMVGRPSVEYDMDWKALAEGACAGYIGGAP